MSINCSDVVEALSGHLHAAGYRIHNGDAELGETVDDESGPHWWFTWTVDGVAGVECGKTCSTQLEALADAMANFFAFARLPICTTVTGPNRATHNGASTAIAGCTASTDCPRASDCARGDPAHVYRVLPPARSATAHDCDYFIRAA